MVWVHAIFGYPYSKSTHHTCTRAMKMLQPGSLPNIRIWLLCVCFWDGIISQIASTCTNVDPAHRIKETNETQHQHFVKTPIFLTASILRYLVVCSNNCSFSQHETCEAKSLKNVTYVSPLRSTVMHNSMPCPWIARWSALPLRLEAGARLYSTCCSSPCLNHERKWNWEWFW